MTEVLASKVVYYDETITIWKLKFYKKIIKLMFNTQVYPLLEDYLVLWLNTIGCFNNINKIAITHLNTINNDININHFCLNWTILDVFEF